MMQLHEIAIMKHIAQHCTVTSSNIRVSSRGHSNRLV